jgi:hypothetical protein
MIVLDRAVVVSAAYVAAELVRRCHTAGQPVPAGVMTTLNALTHAIADSGNNIRPDDTDTPRWESVAEHAAVTGLPERTVRHGCATGRIQAEKVGSRWVIPS